MKKVLLVIAIIFVCGCSNKVVCIYNGSYDDVKIRNKIIFDFKTNKYRQIDTMIFKNSEKAKEYFEDIEEYAGEYNLKLKKNKIVSEITDDIKEKSSKKEIKDKFENYDYVCK